MKGVGKYRSVWRILSSERNYIEKVKYFIVLILGLLMFNSNFYKPVHVFMIGDSTMAEKPEKALPENGWGMAVGKLTSFCLLICPGIYFLSFALLHPLQT